MVPVNPRGKFKCTLSSSSLQNAPPHLATSPSLHPATHPILRAQSADLRWHARPINATYLAAPVAEPLCRPLRCRCGTAAVPPCSAAVSPKNFLGKITRNESFFHHSFIKFNFGLGIHPIAGSCATRRQLASWQNHSRWYVVYDMIHQILEFY